MIYKGLLQGKVTYL